MDKISNKFQIPNSNQNKNCFVVDDIFFFAMVNSRHVFVISNWRWILFCQQYCCFLVSGWVGIWDYYLPLSILSIRL